MRITNKETIIFIFIEIFFLTVKKIIFLSISLGNVFCLNIYIFTQKIKKKKIILFYHPKENLTKIHTFYLEKEFKKNKKYKVIFASKIFSPNHFYVKELLLKYIILVDFFLSNNVSNNFTMNSKKLYMHHDIYDTPLVDFTEENNLKTRLKKYDYILLPSKKSEYVFRKIFQNEKYKPTLLYLNFYPKLNFLLKKIKFQIKKLNTVIIAPTNYKSFQGFTIINYIDELIEGLLKLNYKVIYRPHPSNINEDNIKKTYSKFSNCNQFLLDDSTNYLNTYKASDVMITDMSGTSYTYALLTMKPVIFFSLNEDKITNSYYKELNFFKDRKKIGKVFYRTKSILNFLGKKKKFNNIKKNIENIKRSHFDNKKKSIFDIIDTIL